MKPRDLWSTGRFVYASSVDIGRDDGPGVNEREFVLEFLRTFGERAAALLPVPSRPVRELDGLPVFHSHNPRRFHPVHNPLHHLLHAAAARRLIRTHKPDVVVLRMVPLPWSALAITSLGVPLAVKTLGDGVFEAVESLPRLLRGPVGALNRRVLRAVVKRSIVVDVCTEQFLTWLPGRLGLSSGRFARIENATNTKRFQPGSAAEARARTGLTRFDPIIGFVGGRPADRGGRQMIEAVHKLRTTYPRIGAVIVGGGGLTPLQELARSLNVENHVLLAGAVPYDLVPDYINAFDVGISLDVADRLEQIGNSSQKIRQYVACGRPVVAGSHGNSFLQSESLGSLIQVDDVDGLVSAADTWLAMDAAARAAFARRAAQYAATHLSVAAALRQRVDLWQRCLE